MKTVHIDDKEPFVNDCIYRKETKYFSGCLNHLNQISSLCMLETVGIDCIEASCEFYKNTKEDSIHEDRI